jgi:methionine-rich copper-binding protein CopC
MIRHWSRRIGRSRLVEMLALVVGGLVVASLAWGHALLVDSIPKPGQTVTTVREIVLRFNSRIEKPLSSVTLQGPGTALIALKRSEATYGPDTLAYQVPALPTGSYRATWKVLSTDGHLTEGILAFQLAEPLRRE